MTIEELKKHNDKHQANDFIEKYVKGRKGQKERKTLFAWVLEDFELEPNPRQYLHSTGPWGKTKI
jgi:hypothetical protein